MTPTVLRLSFQGAKQETPVPSAKRVAAKYLRAKQTEDAAKLGKFLHSFSEALNEFVLSGMTDDSMAKNVATIAVRAKKELDLTFEDEDVEEGAQAIMGGYHMLLDILSQFGKARDARSMSRTLHQLDRSAPAPLQIALQVLFENALRVVDSFDFEVLDHLSVGPYSLLLTSSPDADWDEEKVHVAQESLERLAKVLREAGFGKFVGGTVQAYPGPRLPPSSGAPGPSTLGIYHAKKDMFWMAGGEDVPRIVQTMVHETGHRVYFRGLSANARASWDSFFEENQVHPGRILARIMRAWEKARDEALANGKEEDEANWIGTLARAVAGNPELDFWVQIIGTRFSNSQHLSFYDVKKNYKDIKTFMYPVTPYSASNAKELYAEVFAHYILFGPRRVPEIVRVFFQRVTPGLKMGSDESASIG